MLHLDHAISKTNNTFIDNAENNFDIVIPMHNLFK